MLRLVTRSRGFVCLFSHAPPGEEDISTFYSLGRPIIMAKPNYTGVDNLYIKGSQNYQIL